MKKKLITLACVALIICLLSSAMYFVSANSSTPELKDLPKEQRDDIIQQKKEMDRKQESALSQEEPPARESAASQEQSITQESNAEQGDEAPSLDFSSPEAHFYSAGFTEEDLRVVPEAEISAYGEVEITQDYIYDRMLNTMDFYGALQGRFCVTQSNTGGSYEVEYSVNNDNHQSFERITHYDASRGRTMDTFPSHEIVCHYDGKTYQEAIINYEDSGKRSMPEKEITHTAHIDAEEKENLDFIALIKPTSRVQTDSEGINTYYYRQSANSLGYSRASLEPQELTIGYLRDFSTWEIARQETLLDRSCSVIQGTLSGDYSEKLHTTDFTLWVDNETGVLLQLEGYSADGELSETLTTSEFQVDSPSVTASAIQEMFDQA